LTAWVPLHY